MTIIRTYIIIVLSGRETETGNTFRVRGKAETGGKGEKMGNMNMAEASRVILGLRAAGWDEKSINDFILWIETGEEQYKPSTKEKAE